MPEATIEIKITEYNPAFIEKFVESKRPIFISTVNATKDDIEYIQKLFKKGNSIKQSDLRDNMTVFEYNERGEVAFLLRSVNMEQEYQEWQEEVKALKVEPIEGIEGTTKPLEGGE